MEEKNILGEERIGKLLFKLAAPAIVAQIINVLYNIIDRIFIGRMENGDLAMAGVGVAFPILILISAFSSLIGFGGAPLCAIKMGEKNNKEAERIMGNSFCMLIILGLVLTIGFMIFKEPILWAFGASEATIGYAIDYLKIYLLGTVFVQIALGMNPYINTQGFAKIGMITVVIGAIINIILDPILIFTFDLGVKGAALATILAQLVSAIWVVIFLLSKKSILKIRLKNFKLNIGVVGRTLALGISPFVMQSTESLVLISLNTQLVKYGGDLAVSSMTIMSSIMQIITLPLMGLTQGAQPIISYNYGASNLERVKKTFKLLLKCCLTFSITMCLAVIFLPEFFVRLFNNDPKLIEITTWSMRIYFAGVFMMGAQMACQQTFLSLGQAKISLILAMLRKIVLLIPLIYILPLIMDNKLKGVLFAEPVADILAATITVICFVKFYRKELN